MTKNTSRRSVELSVWRVTSRLAVVFSTDWERNWPFCVSNMTSDQYFLAITAIQNRLHAYILSLLADPAAAQDVLQETNLVLIRKADNFQSDASFES